MVAEREALSIVVSYDDYRVPESHIESQILIHFSRNTKKRLYIDLV